jgi:hypothetical protein
LAERLREGFELRMIDGEAVQALVAAKVEVAAEDPEPPELEVPDPAAGDVPQPAVPEAPGAGTAAADAEGDAKLRRKRHRPGGPAQ